MVGILLHSCTQRQNSIELRSVCRLSQAVLSEMTARVRMSCAGQSESLMDGTVLTLRQGAISYECWTKLDFNNELEGER